MCSASGKKVPEAEPDDNVTICKKWKMEKQNLAPAFRALVAR